MNEYRNETVITHSSAENLITISPSDLQVIGYLALLSMSNRYADKSKRELAKQIGKVRMDVLEPEFSKYDKKYLVELCKYLENEYSNMEKLNELDNYRQKFIANGKNVIEKLGYSILYLLEVGVPTETLIDAGILQFKNNINYT